MAVAEEGEVSVEESHMRDGAEIRDKVTHRLIGSGHRQAKPAAVQSKEERREGKRRGKRRHSMRTWRLRLKGMYHG